MKGYVLDYFDEIEFAQLSRSLKKYNYDAFEILTLQYYPFLRCGNFVGNLISKDDVHNTETYEIKLPSSKLFALVHGEVRLRYVVAKDSGIVMLDTILPSDLLLEGISLDLQKYREVIVSHMNYQKNKLMIDMLLSKNNKEDLYRTINLDSEEHKHICPHCNGTGFID